MTEQEWLTSEDPARILEFVRNPAHAGIGGQPYVSERKVRLFACACGRSGSRLGDDLTRRALDCVEAHEKFADGFISVVEFNVIYERLYYRAAWHLADPPSSWLEEELDWADCPKQVQAALLREIVGNPFSDLVYNLNHLVQTPDDKVYKFTSPRLRRWLTWNDGCVRKMAESIYQEHAWDRLPILADALADAGCDDEAILKHLRRPADCRTCDNTGVGTDEYSGRSVIPGGCPRCGGEAGPHVRGCWVVDLLTGRN